MFGSVAAARWQDVMKEVVQPASASILCKASEETQALHTYYAKEDDAYMTHATDEAPR